MQTGLNRRTPNTDYEAVDFSKYKAHRIIVCKLVIVRVEYRRVRRMLVLQYGSDATVLADRMHIVLHGGHTIQKEANGINIIEAGIINY